MTPLIAEVYRSAPVDFSEALESLLGSIVAQAQAWHVEPVGTLVFHSQHVEHDQPPPGRGCLRRFAAELYASSGEGGALATQPPSPACAP